MVVFHCILPECVETTCASWILNSEVVHRGAAFFAKYSWKCASEPEVLKQSGCLVFEIHNIFSCLYFLYFVLFCLGCCFFVLVWFGLVLVFCCCCFGVFCCSCLIVFCLFVCFVFISKVWKGAMKIRTGHLIHRNNYFFKAFEGKTKNYLILTEVKARICSAVSSPDLCFKRICPYYLVFSQWAADKINSLNGFCVCVWSFVVVFKLLLCFCLFVCFVLFFLNEIHYNLVCCFLF